ncbi:50S ribosomal protein L13 [bacterium endosymbiont of Pedicinus badii]|uniref:50S ribosomal protein L13 n=1 Tax=bacterium endosymbiont of Pedicinus badii TaxID=1719126 RepID=UPI0009BB5FE2|nr:50S ribosomal protein L13 [bacterium endosymbiont of Pedicinus badii]OQM34152.1 50S ribosomal protein L13 [bacterium endosymbiont of Pedicinus badii]
MKTFVAKKNSIPKKWYIIDAKGKILGRISTKIASILRGKNKPEYTPNIDVGDYVIVLNAKYIKVTGRKEQKKKYYRYTGYVGGLKKSTFSEVFKKNCKKIIYLSVRGMMPKGPLGRKMLKKLKIYEFNVHKHTAQKPKVLKI